LFLDAAAAHDTEHNQKINQISESTYDTGNLDFFSINFIIFTKELVNYKELLYILYLYYNYKEHIEDVSVILYFLFNI